MMNVLEVPSSECSSGCESGWTLYLEHSTSNYSVGYKRRSFGGENQQHQLKKLATFDQDDGFFDDDEQDYHDDQEEDLSMVSDASSGPPHFDHDLDEDELDLCYNNNDNIYSNNIGDERLRKRSVKSSYEHETQCCSNTGVDFALDDTASSHVFTSSNKKIGGVHVQNQGASFERLIDTYPSSQGCSANQVQVQGKSNYHEGCGYIQSSYSTKGFHQHNQWAN